MSWVVGRTKWEITHEATKGGRGREMKGERELDRERERWTNRDEGRERIGQREREGDGKQK